MTKEKGSPLREPLGTTYPGLWPGSVVKASIHPLLGPILACLACGACASLVPAPPRFIEVYGQHTGDCHLAVIKDTRSPGCWVWYRCGRQPPGLVPASSDVCVP